MTDMVHTPVMRICKKCGQKALHYKTVYSHCIVCHGKYNKIKHKLDKETHNKISQKSRYKNKYGITLDEYNKMLEKQKGLCANSYCGSNLRLSVDHCHDTGIVRGILCNTCNLALGQIDDNKRRLKGLIEYLENFEQKLEDIQSKYEGIVYE